MLTKGTEIETAGAAGQLLVKAKPSFDGENRARCGRVMPSLSEAIAA